MTESTAHIRIERQDSIATIVIDRQDKMNAMTMDMRRKIRTSIEELDADPVVRVLIIRGAGERAFSAGGDIGAFLQMRPDQLAELHDNIAAPERCSKPVIAAVRGYCFGAGFELSLACDFVIATEDSQFALPEINLGMIPGSGGSQRIARIAGLIRAKDMIMLGKRVTAAQAVQWGLISRAVPVDDWDQEVQATARQLAGYSPLALATLKRVLNGAPNGPLGLSLELEGYAYGLLRSSEDFREGVEAFLEKRTAEFKGR